MTRSPLRKRLRAIAEDFGLGAALFRYVEWREGRRAPEFPRADSDEIPLPPAWLMFQVASHTDWRGFLESGASALRIFDAAAGRAGLPFADARHILDFGCGCGRIARHLPQTTNAALDGVDYNPRLVRWCAQNLPGSFRVNRAQPPLAFPDGRFDIVYLFSVFTHLRRDTQDAWLAEFARILRPGGLALVTFHDEDHPSLSSVGLGVEELQSRGHVVHHDTAEGSNYMATFQSRAFTRDQCTAYFDVVEMIGSQDAGFGQALAVLRRR